MRILYLLSSTRWLDQRALTLSVTLLALTGFLASAGATYPAIAQSPSTSQEGAYEGAEQPAWESRLHSSSSAAFAAAPKRRLGGGTTQPPKGTAHGERAYKPFTPKGKEEVRAENAQKHDGTNHCESCGVQTVPAQQSKKGVTPPPTETQVDHVIPRVKGGDGAPPNGQVLCRDCNNKKGDKDG